MALKLYDRVLEFTTSTGYTSFELSNESPSGFTTFQSGVGHGIGTYYAATHQSTEEWEVGYGIVTSGDPLYPSKGDAPILSRLQVLASSSDDQLVEFSAGTKDVFVSYPASASVFLDQNGNVALGSGLSGVSPDTKYRLYIAGDLRASGVHAGSGLTLWRDAAAPDTTTDTLYNLGGSLYWDNQLISTTQANLLTIYNGDFDSGIHNKEDVTLGVGSGIIFASGAGIHIDLFDAGNGSGVVTIGTSGLMEDFWLVADNGDPPIELTNSSGIYIAGGTNITTSMARGTGTSAGSGIITIDGNVYTAGTGIHSGSLNDLQINALSGSLEQAGIVRLSNVVNHHSGVAITPYGVQQSIASGSISQLSFGAINTDETDFVAGTSSGKKVILGNSSGIMIRGVSPQISLDFDDDMNGSGTITIQALAYNAGTGILLEPDTGSGRDINLNIPGLNQMCEQSNFEGPGDNDLIAIHDESLDTTYRLTVSGLAANPSFAGGNKFYAANILADGSSFTWGSGLIQADEGQDTLTFVEGTGIILDTDVSQDAIRINTEPFYIGASGAAGGNSIAIYGPSGIFFQAGNDMAITLSDGGNGSGIVNISSTFAEAGLVDSAFKTIEIETSGDAGYTWGTSSVSAASATDKLKLVPGSGIIIQSDPTETALTIALSGGLAGGAAENSFTTVSHNQDAGYTWQLGQSVTADSASDTLTFVMGTGIRIDGDATNDAIRVSVSGTTIDINDPDSGFTWGTSDVITVPADTLKFVAGTGIQLLSDATNKAIRISHEDISAIGDASDTSNVGDVFIQNISVDDYGHLTAITSATAAAAGGAANAGAASGVNQQLQFNNNGHFAGANLYYASGEDSLCGFLGIGTSSPRVQLDVAGTGVAAEACIREDYFDGGGTYGFVGIGSGLNPHIEFRNTTFNVGLHMGPYIAYEGTATETKSFGMYAFGETSDEIIGLTIGTSGSSSAGLHEHISLVSRSGTPVTEIKLEAEKINIQALDTINLHGEVVLKNGLTWDTRFTTQNLTVDTNGGNHLFFDDSQLGNTTGGSGVVILEAGRDGFTHTIKKVGNSPSGILIQPPAGYTIDGVTDNATLWVQGDSVTLMKASGVDKDGNIQSNNYNIIHKSFSPHTASVSMQGAFWLPRLTRRIVPFDTVDWASPSGMVAFPGSGSLHDSNQFVLENVNWSTNFPVYGGGSPTSTSSYGNAHIVKVVRAGYYRVNAEMWMGYSLHNGDRKYMQWLRPAQLGIQHISASGTAIRWLALDEKIPGYPTNSKAIVLNCQGTVYMKKGEGVCMSVYHSNSHHNTYIPVGDITNGAATAPGNQTYAMPKMSIVEIDPASNLSPNSSSMLGSKRHDYLGQHQ